MVDTGATISCIPENGIIMKRSKVIPCKANIVITLADGGTTHINKKIKASINPKGSLVKPSMATLYIQPGATDVLGFPALIGLKHLKRFELDIITRDGRIYIYHQKKLIGRESSGLNNIQAGARLVDNIIPIDDLNIRRILSRYKSVFTDIDPYNPIQVRPMRFLTVHQRPIFAKQKHYTPEEVIAMKNHIDTLLKSGIIEPSNSGYAANSRIIPKKNGTGRLVINYIPLNTVTYRDSYALPHISDILGVIQGNQYFTTMDCMQGFYQIDVDIRDRHKTGFSTPVGNYQFKRCPFGARNSCAVFQAAMNTIFFDGLYKRCVVYVDDILVFGKTKQEHDDNLNWVLAKCAQFNVKIKLEKCHFCKKEVQYLGFIISGSFIKPMQDRVDVLTRTEHPRDRTELKSIIGKLNFYARFIPNYSQRLEPLRTLLLKNKDYQWKTYHQEAFESLIKQLKCSDSHVLVPRDCHKYLQLHVLEDSVEVILYTDNNKLISRASRLLTSAESNYSLTEKQLLALVFAVNKFVLLLNPERYTIRLPDNHLESVLKQVNRSERIDNWLLKLPPNYDTFKFEIDTSINKVNHRKQKAHVAQEIYYVDGACKANGKPNCRASWAVCAEFDKQLEITGFVEINPSNQSAELTAAIKACEIAKQRQHQDITIVTDSKYLFSAATLWIDKWKNNDWKDHKNKPIVNEELFKQLLHVKEGLNIEWLHVKGHSDNQGNIRADMLARGLLDTKVATINAIINSCERLQDDPEILQLKEDIKLGRAKDNLIIFNDIVYYVDPKLPEECQRRIYVPTKSRHYLLTLAHDDNMYGGHLGIKKTYRKLLRFWWPKIHDNVDSYVRSCDTCQKFKNPSGLPPGYLHPIPVSNIFEHVHIDIVGPIKTSYSGNNYVITATDAFSKFAFAKPSHRVRTTELILFVEEAILAIHGKPKIIITDRGTQFISHEWKEFMDKHNIEHRLTTSYHPQTNGIDERLNGTLVRILRAYVDEHQEKWDSHLKWALYVYNTTIHESTGYSPYQILHGLNNRSPLKPIEHELSNLEELSTIRESIRTDVNERNKFSQEQQKLYYDRKRSTPKLYVGQLVYIKIHAIRSDLSKKFHIKWDGPVVIIKLIGDKDNPKTVEILDYDNMLKKIVAITDVKPVIDTYEKPTDKTQKSEGRTLEDSSASGYDDNLAQLISYSSGKPRFTCNDFNYTPNTNNLCDSTQIQTCNSPPKPYSPPPNHNSPVAQDSSLDLTHITTTGPIASSPRRVTINDTIRTHYYPPSTLEEQPSKINQDKTSITQQALSIPQTIQEESTQIVEPTHTNDTGETVLARPNTVQQNEHNNRRYGRSDDDPKDLNYQPPKTILKPNEIRSRPITRSMTHSRIPRLSPTLDNQPNNPTNTTNDTTVICTTNSTSNPETTSDKIALLVDIYEEDLIQL